MTHKAQVRLVVLLGLLLTVIQTGFGQAPLSIAGNYFVTGDYIVSGATGIETNFSGAYTIGTFTIPDKNPGITGATSLPAGAQVVDAILYWQTVEKTGATPGGPGSGQNGFFRPLNVIGATGAPPAPGYAISGINVSNHNTVGWSSGGCNGTSTGKVLQTYRADVVGYLAQDGNGNVLVNGTYQVMLPSVGNPSTPITLGATLVVIYRLITTVPGAVAPLDSVVIYEGAYAPTSTTLTMTQSIQGFYQAGNDQGGPVISRLTHIVGNGKSNKYENVSFNNVALPSLYGAGKPAFPGYYGTWDNPTWTFNPKLGTLANPITAGLGQVTTMVTPSLSNQGCVSWGAVIVGTTVQDSKLDGILDVWKENQGYTDAVTGNPVSLVDEPLPGNQADPPGVGQKDVFIQLDYVTELSGASFEPNAQTLQNVRTAFLNKGVHLHFTGFNPIQVGECTDAAGQPLCPYPSQPGVITWRGGLEFVKNYLIPLPGFGNNPNTCTANPQDCVPRFNPAQKDSYHYVVFGDSVGGASWSLGDGSLASVVASGTTVTFTTSTSFPFWPATADSCGQYGRVSISDAITNPALNGTYCVTGSVDATHFTITIPTATNAKYTLATDPNLAVATGLASSRSGTSDLGGAISLITLGQWGTDGQSTNVQAGTLMHELGHTFYLPHGGVYYNTPATPYVPTFENNCKPNYQSVMSYLFQVDLLDKYDPINGFVGGYLDYSEDTLTTLNEGSLSSVMDLTTSNDGTPTYASTAWYTTTAQAGTAASRYCDGTPPGPNFPTAYRVDGAVSPLSWTNNQNIAFVPTPVPATMHGFSDWTSVDLRQIGATGDSYVLGGAFPHGGGAFPSGGGAFPSGGGAFPSGGGAFPHGGGAFPHGGGTAGDITHQTANSVTRSPRNLTASEAASPRTVTLNWSAPTFGQIGTYNIYRSANGGLTFSLFASVSGNPPGTSYIDNTLTCNPTGYQYFVTAVLFNTTQESVPSNIVPVGNPITGCYTLSGFSSPAAGASAPAGNIVPIRFEVQDDYYTTAGVVGSLGAHNVLSAIGPIPSDGTCSGLAQPPVLLNHVGPYPYTVTTLSSAGMGLGFGSNQFTYNWNTATTSPSAGCYFFELDLDSNQYEQSSVFTLLILESGPTITTTTLPNDIVGTPYNSTLTELGGTPPLTYTVTSGSLPQGINLSASSGALTGTPTAPGTYSFAVQVTDSLGNFSTLGTPSLSITVAPSGQTASTLSALVNGPAKTVVAYVAKGSWNAGNNAPGGGPGISAINIEGNSITNGVILTGLEVVNSCASNALTNTTVCTGDSNGVYVLNGTTVMNTLTSGATGNAIAFQGGQCSTCEVVMDSVDNQAVLIVADGNPIGAYQVLNLNGTPSLGSIQPSSASTNTAANVSPGVFVDPTRNSTNHGGNPSYGSGVIVLSAGESGNFEIVDETNPSMPAFFENILPGLGFAFATEPESSAEDTSTGIAVVPVGLANPAQLYLADLTQGSFTPSIWTTPAAQVQTMTEATNLQPLGASSIAIAQGSTHTGVVSGDIGGNTITAILLPSTSGSGTPALNDWVTCQLPPIPVPNSLPIPFAQGYDPHPVTAYQSPSSGDAIALITDSSGLNAGPGYVAIVDLTQMLNTTTVPRTAGQGLGHACSSGALPATAVRYIAVP